MILGTLSEFKELRKTQWLSPHELKRLQEKKLRAILKHAYQNVEYYHECFRSLGIYPDEIKNLEDLSKLPVISKEDIQRDFSKFISKNVKEDDRVIGRTTGSTGKPLKIIHDRRTRAFNTALMLRPFWENGLRPHHKLLQITDPRHFIRKAWYQRAGFFREKAISIFDPPENHIKILENYKPDFIYGYPSALFLMSQVLTKETKTGPSKIFTSSELLTDKTRGSLNTAFGTDVIDLYGATEFYRMAWECEKHEGYHIDSEAIIMEFLNDEGPAGDESGEMVATGLHNYAMPLIRYKIGDRGTPTEELCSCGRGLPLMKEIIGRGDDFLTLPSGRLVSPRSINIIEDIPGVREYRTIQEERGRIVVHLVKGREFSQMTLQQIKEQILKGCMGEDVEIAIETVDRLPRDETGKIRTVVSKVRYSN